MILVDSSVMIDALRKPDPKLKNLFNTLKPAICGIVKAEILHGARDPADYAKLVKAFAPMPWVAIPESMWETLGGNLWSLRTNGVSVPFQDVAIATVAIDNGLELCTRDSQFQHVQAVIPALRLLQEPP